MLSLARKLLHRRLEEQRDDTHAAVELATAALLVEIARADHVLHEAERDALRAQIEQHLRLPATDVTALLDAAAQAVEDSVSLHEFTHLLNRHLPPAQRRRLVESLWRVALADGHVDALEEHGIRKIASLLHVSHDAFIAAKLRAGAAPGSRA